MSSCRPDWRAPIRDRTLFEATLASLLRGSLPGLRLNEHLAHDGENIFQHACKMGLEGIVSKRLGSRYRSGQSPTRVVFLVRIALVRRRRYGCGTMLGTSALSPGRGRDEDSATDPSGGWTDGHGVDSNAGPSGRVQYSNKVCLPCLQHLGQPARLAGRSRLRPHHC